MMLLKLLGCYCVERISIGQLNIHERRRYSLSLGVISFEHRAHLGHLSCSYQFTKE